MDIGHNVQREDVPRDYCNQRSDKHDYKLQVSKVRGNKK
jgi:hypothetical protein